MPQTILLLHDDVSRAVEFEAWLNQSSEGTFSIESTRSGAAALHRLSELSKPAIAAVVMDLLPPEGRALDTFDRLLAGCGQVPILILSAPEHEEIAKKAVQRGAQDYILSDCLDQDALSKALRNMIERAVNAEALFLERERAQVTLNSIGDAVISTYVTGEITYLNPVAEAMTGWTAAEAIGRQFGDVIRIFDKRNPQHPVNPMAIAMQQNKVVGLSGSCIMIRRDGTECAVEDSAAPIHDRRGRVTGAVMVFHDVTQARAMSQRMSYLAHHDYLTELPNRLLLDDRLAQAMAAARRHRQRLAVLFVDLDRFKYINDSLGHATGDELLRSIAGRLVASVRGSDTVCRQGGDEFVILLSRITHSEDAALTATKILTSLALPHRVKDHTLEITASIGIGVYPEDGTEGWTLVKSADTAMLSAKHSGRNTYQFFAPHMNVHALERRSVENGLRQALERREFVLHYQPKIDLQTETICGAEALIRWQQPDGSLVRPEKFIPVAEECGYIVQIGRWVLREACSQARTWLDYGFAPVPIAINVSAVELRSKDFAACVRAVLEETGLDPRYLELELTETALLQDHQATVAVLNSLRDLGVTLALDDFGTGYSSLNHLKRLPIGAVKIDKSFVGGLCTNIDDANIVEAVIHMGRSFHLRVIAEGVETREQFLRLRAQQCAEGQGDYFQGVLPGTVFGKLLESDLSATIVA